MLGTVSWQQRSHDLISRTAPVAEDGVWAPMEPALAAVAPHGPVDYVIEIHPPLVIENLLPHRGVFEIMHTEASAGRKKMLWCELGFRNFNICQNRSEIFGKFPK